MTDEKRIMAIKTTSDRYFNHTRKRL